MLCITRGIGKQHASAAPGFKELLGLLVALQKRGGNEKAECVQSRWDGGSRSRVAQYNRPPYRVHSVSSEDEIGLVGGSVLEQRPRYRELTNTSPSWIDNSGPAAAEWSS